MHAPVGFPSHEALEASLERDFAAGTTWPISFPAMAALVDMDLSDDKIARYFGVAPGAVSALRTGYGLGKSDA
ncbi:MAG TPA: hypothetical protein VE175_14280 [Woeseiaceae bacterium]|nr:hypothetical protein [Woeseiaceae bacterium]